MQLSIGALIWISVRPLISRLWLSGAFGFAITKANLFPLDASRGTGQVVLNVTLPCLMFSKVVPAFTSQNINSLGVLVAVAFMYEAIGLFFAWTVKQFCWIPHRFRYGILCAGTVMNYSDIPTAVITSITANAPFNSSTDETISVAYVAGFILVFFISLFPMGAHRLVAMDFDGPDVEDEDLRMSMSAKSKQNMSNFAHLLQAIPHPGKKPHPDDPSADLEKDATEEGAMEKSAEKAAVSSTKASAAPNASRATPQHTDGAPAGNARFTLLSEDSTAAPTEVGPSLAGSRAPSPVHAGTEPPFALASAHARAPFRTRALGIARSAARSFLLPCSITIVFSIVIAVVTPLKALFTPVTNSPIPNAPDGQPPLAFILDCATFVGAASVPLGLICLGSAVARVRLPRRGEWNKLPLAAIIWFSVTKMLVVPVLGVLIIQGLVRSGFIDRDDKVLRFVCMFLSCVPTATSQVYLTQVYSGTGEAGTLPLFLVPQYVLMFISMTVLIAYSLSILF